MIEQNGGEETPVLRVRMFGDFCMEYDGKRLEQSGQQRSSQFVSLMQVILHSAKTGIGRDRLEEILFEGRKVGDLHNSLRVLLHKGKTRMRELGLPEVNYIRQSKGVYRWNEEIPVKSDAEEFTRLYEETRQETDPKNSLGNYMRMCELYRGEFLPDCTLKNWAAGERKRYRRMFRDAVRQSGKMLEAKEDWESLLKLGQLATAAEPFSGWELITLRALIECGRSEEARTFYESTAERYLKERGIYPSARMQKLLEHLGGPANDPEERVETIRKKLNENREQVNGGYFCSYPVFRGVYQAVRRKMERDGISAQLMLCTLVDGDGNPLKNGERRELLSGELRNAITESIRHGDVVTQMEDGSYLVLLVNTTGENCEIIQGRIDRRFAVGHRRVGVKYYANSVLYEM